MDIATVAGVAICALAILGSILVAAPLTIFIDVPSMLVVFLGLLGATLIKWPLEIVTGASKVGMKALFFEPADPKPLIEELFNLAETARRESVFALEKVPIDDQPIEHLW